MFKNLALQGWRQYRNIDIAFHPRLTLLTGANGAGKTTLLNLVSRHFGWSSALISTPRRHGASDQLKYSADYWDEELINLLALAAADADAQEVPLQVVRDCGTQTAIGTIVYENETIASLMVQKDVGSTYNVDITNQQIVDGLHIASHRSATTYQQLQSIPTAPRKRREVFDNYLGLIRQRILGHHTAHSPQYYMKETIVAWAVFGPGNEATQSDPEAHQAFRDFEEVLRRMLPPTLGFRRLMVRAPEVVLETDTGEFSLDAVSGGVSAVIELAWQIFMYGNSGARFVVTIDEPENHLHPALQRRVLADLLNAFPNVQFVVATHSPFIVGSVPDSTVYVLAYDSNQKVYSEKLDTANRAGTANEILREVLGLNVTIPIWVEDRLEGIVERYAGLDFNSATLVALRAEMQQIGLAGQIPQTIAQIAGRKDVQ